jgi:hypothetical protein
MRMKNKDITTDVHAGLHDYTDEELEKIRAMKGKNQ